LATLLVVARSGPGSRCEILDLARLDTVPNLQLLAGIPNIEKQAATLPADWLNGPHFPPAEKRTHYLEQNDLGGLPLEIDRFLEFHADRRDLMLSDCEAFLAPVICPTPGSPRQRPRSAGQLVPRVAPR
jgi:hypothetical protein